MKLELLDELTQQHRELESLLTILCVADTADDQRGLIERLADVMSTHIAIEGCELHPELAHLDGLLIEEAEIEHDWARVEVNRLSEMIGQPGFGVAVSALEQGFAHHVNDEETVAFPKLRRAWADAACASPLGAVEPHNPGAETEVA